MADANAVVIPVRFVGDAGDGVAQITDDLDKLKAAATGAGEQATEGFDKAGESVDGLSTAIAAADVATEKLNAAASENQIEAAALDAAIAAGKLKEALVKAATAGQDTTKGVVAINNLGTAAKSAADRMQEISVEASDLEKAIKKANTAARGLEGATGMRQLSRGSREATMAMVELKEEMEKIRAAGGKVDDEAVKALENVENAALRAKTKLAVVGDAVGDTGTKANLAAKGFEAVAGSAGSMDAMMAKLKDTGTPFQEKIADIGFGVVALTSAFEMGYAQGEKLRKLMDEFKGESFLNFSNQIADLIVEMNALDKKQGDKPKQGFWASLKGELVDYGVALGLVSNQEDEYNAKMDKKLQKAEAHNVAMEAGRKALDSALAALQKLNPEVQRGGDAYASATAELKAWNGYLEIAVRKKEDLKGFFDTNSEALKKLHQHLIDGKVPIEKWGDALKGAFDRAGLATTQAGVLGVAVKSFAKDMETIKSSMTPLTTEQGQLVTRALSDVSTKLKDFYDEGTRFSLFGTRIKDSAGQATDGISSVGVEGLIAKGNLKQLRDEVENDIGAFVALGVAAQKSGVDGLKFFREKILDLLPAQQASKIAGEVYAESVKESNKALTEGTEALAEQRAGMVAAREAGHLAELQNEANSLAAESWGGSLDDVAGKVVQLNKEAGRNIAQMAVGTPMYFQVAKATKEQADELKRLIELQGEWLKKQTAILDKAPGWTDYLVQLKKGYDSGMTSLNVYLNSLNQFQTQIRQLFAGGGAGAQKAIAEITNMIEAMQKAAMMGEPVKNGIQALDQLAAYANRMFGDLATAEQGFLDKSSMQWGDYFTKLDAARKKTQDEWELTKTKVAEQDEAVKNVSANVVSATEATGMWVTKTREVSDGLIAVRNEWVELKKATEENNPAEAVDEPLGHWVYTMVQLADGIRLVRKEWREMQEELRMGTQQMVENLGGPESMGSQSGPTGSEGIKNPGEGKSNVWNKPRPRPLPPAGA